MPIAGLVLRVAQPESAAATLMAALSRMPGVSVGTACSDCLPVVLEADSQASFDAAWRELAALPEVALVELAFADFSDLELQSDYEPLRRERPFLGGDDGPA